MATTRAFSCFDGGRGKLPVEYCDPENWPPFDESVLVGKTKTRFKALKTAVQLYLTFGPMDEVLKAAKVSANRFRRLFRRCGQLTTTGELVGWAGLVAGRSIAPRRREAAIKVSAGGKAGWVGAFGKLLAEKRKITDELTDYLNAFGVKALRPNQVQFRSIRRRFVKICREQGVREDEYPLNTRERGRRSLRAWIDQVYMPQYANRFIGLEHGTEAGALNAYAEGDGSAELPAAPYSAWMFDEVTLDVAARYEFPNPQGDWEELELARFFQLRLIDRGSGATLAVRQVFAAQASADDIAMLFWDALHGPLEVPKPIEGETLLEGAGFPSVAIEKLRYAMPSVILMDRALSHLAGHVQYIATVLFGARVVMGPARTPRERAEVESRFSAQARRVLHQLPGTTGSGPQDPVRKRAAVPVEGRLRAVEIEQVLDAYARNENATPAAASFNIAPLDRLRRQLEAGVLQPTYLAPDKRKPYFFAQPVRVTVRVDQAKGIRPHVNYLYVRYSSAELGKDYAMRGKTLWLRPDLRNLRTVMLFREDGTVYGPVQVLGKWGAFPHDQRLRRLFGRLKREGELGERADDQPLEALFAHLRSKAPRDRKAALQLTYLVEYLSRNAVPLSPSLTQGVWDWRQLKEAAADVTVLPVRRPPPAAPAPEVVRPGPRPQAPRPPAAGAALALRPPVRSIPAPMFRPRPSVSR